MKVKLIFLLNKILFNFLEQQFLTTIQHNKFYDVKVANNPLNQIFFNNTIFSHILTVNKSTDL